MYINGGIWMRFFAIFAVLVMAASSFAVTAQYWGGYRPASTYCLGQGYTFGESLVVANAPGDVSCASPKLYNCPDVIKLNTTTSGYVFGGPNDVTPGTVYYKEVLVDFIGRTNNGNDLNGFYDRNAPKNLWRPRVFMQLPGHSCLNWNYLNFNDASAANLIGFSPADNGANRGGFYLVNDTNGAYVPTLDGAGEIGAEGGNMPSGEVMSDGAIVMKEFGATQPDYAGIRVYNLGATRSWAFKEENSYFDMMTYKWVTWSQFQIVPMPFTTERGTAFGHNPLKGTVSFDITPQAAAPRKK